MSLYSGRTALVTGASKGIGKALSRELAARGAHLVLVARSADALGRLAEELRETHGVRAEVVAADLAAPDGPSEVVAALRMRGTEVDLLVNNAGTGAVGPFFAQSFDRDRGSVDLNVTALMALTHGIGSRMLERGHGGIVNIASSAAFQPLPYQAGYAATKAFVLSFTEAVAEELRGSGVRVMGSYPGATDTGFFDGTAATMSPKAVSPHRVAARTLDDFARGRTASFPGRASDRVLTFLPRLLPRSTAVRIAGGVNRRFRHDAV
ncbi:SDR family oxidoreductase [Nocardiopsis sp. NRRL B-16309]|uniref:SDR family NAD(P)-dependent oxidoreductase n=1 Tax=Nocardiopsis sp. NRRL B-16309 TaxID=1519494 RepID=UPI0006B00422|nr:SDR family oxidoreductase [Nocardiopsis sp. NRRL B-16309]